MIEHFLPAEEEAADVNAVELLKERIAAIAARQKSWDAISGERSEPATVRLEARRESRE